MTIFLRTVFLQPNLIVAILIAVIFPTISHSFTLPIGAGDRPCLLHLHNSCTRSAKHKDLTHQVRSKYSSAMTSM